MTALLAIAALCSPVVAIFLSFLLLPHGKSPLPFALGIGFAAATAFYYLRTGLDSDIVRHMEYLSLYRGLGFFQCFDAGHYQTLYVWDMWNWLIAQLDNPYLLQASAALVDYSILSYVVFDAARASSRGKTLLYWLIAISVISPTGFVVGVRSGTACMVASLALYRDYMKNCGCVEAVLLLFVALLIHHSAALFLVAWLLAPLCQRSPLRTCVAVFVVFLGIGVISTSLLAYFPAGGNPLNSFIHSVLAGVVDTAGGDEWSSTHASSLNTRLNTLWSLLLLASLGLSVWRKTMTRDRFEGDFGGVLAAAVIVTTCSIALMFVFPINGGRPLPVAYLLLIVCLIYCDCAVSHRGAKLYDGFDMFVIVIAAGKLLLNVYSLMYGGTEALPLLSGFMMGLFTSFVL